MGSLLPKVSITSFPPMVTLQENSTQANETWALRDVIDDDYNQDFEPTNLSSGCGCFRGLCWWRRGKSNVGRHGYLLHQQQAAEEKELKSASDSQTWLKKKARKLKEISEILAGPRWKNFIRRFSSIHGSNKKRRSLFQYDPQSYELNFDDGIHREVDAGFPDFSARFAAPAGIHKGDQQGHDKASF